MWTCVCVLDNNDYDDGDDVDDDDKHHTQTFITITQTHWEQEKIAIHAFLRSSHYISFSFSCLFVGILSLELSKFFVILILTYANIQCGVV